MPFTKCITKSGGTTTDDAEDLNLVMTMFDLLECRSNYSGTTGSLWLQLMVMLIFRTLKLLKLLSIDLSD